MRLRSSQSQDALTFPEVLTTVVLLSVFFAAIFEINAVCLRYISASKENVAALQLAQDRTEVLRNLAFRDLTDPAFLQGLMAAPANASDLGTRTTETIRLSAYPTPNGVTKLTRQVNGTVTLDSTATTLGTTLVQVEVTTNWTTTFGQRARSEQITTLISNGTKK